jgi:hypothetical protein
LSRTRLTAEGIFARCLAPLYPPGADLAALRTTDANPASNPHILAELDDIAATFARLAPAALAAPTLVLDGSDASVHRLGAALRRDRRDALLAERDGRALAEVVIHGAVYVGACAVRNHGGVWQVRSPLWESLVRLRSRAGIADLAVLQWWLKALADDAVDEPRLADRYRLHVELPTAHPEALPVLAPPERRLPRLLRVRYDTLFRHLRAHLPELGDLGEHFPPPERLAGLGFLWLDFVLVGQGRMLLAYGPTATGVHLLWLNAAGFAGSAYLPGDATGDPALALDGDKVRIRVAVGGRPHEHELLWWGPGA